MFIRKGHGEPSTDSASSARMQLFSIAQSANPTSRQHSFDYMFGPPGAHDQLPVTPTTVEGLKVLAEHMKDPLEGGPDSTIPVAYTYFGQFVDHDLTFDNGPGGIADIAADALVPRGLAGLINERTASVDLDSVYFPDVPRIGDYLDIGLVTALNGIEPPLLRPARKSDHNDLPRQQRSEDENADRAARIGDPRNDENVIVAQLHLAFLKAHNTLVDRGRNFHQAQHEIVARYQTIILDDFLARICDPQVYESLRTTGPRHWRVNSQDEMFMPAEFSFAAYRFGHSMIRTEYNYNLNFPNTNLTQLFSFTALKGQLTPRNPATSEDGTPTLPDNWIIEWERFLPLTADGPHQMAGRIDTQLTDFLFRLQDTFGRPEGEGEPAPIAHIAPRLATRNLLRGFLMGLPTGQAVASRLELPVMQDGPLLDTLPDVLKESATPFAQTTPLWFYILAEAGDPARGVLAGNCLGPVGSTIVMETFMNLIQHSNTSILRDPVMREAYRGTTLADLIRMAAQQDAGN